MQQVLDSAQAAIEQQLSAGDRRLEPDEIPWIQDAGSLRIEALDTGWSWKFLNTTINGLRSCLFEQGIFEEVVVDEVVDLTAPPGQRQMTLTRIEQLKTGNSNNISDTESCYNSRTQTRLSYQLGDSIRAYNMKRILRGVEQELTSKLITDGDQKVTSLPWTYRSNGLSLSAASEGWSWRVLHHTITALHFCLIRRGVFEEVNILSVEDPEAVAGQKLLKLTKERSEGWNPPVDSR